MTSVALLILALVIAYWGWRLYFIGIDLMATITDLNAAIAAETASISALTTAVGGLNTDLTPQVDAVNANRTQVDALTTQLGGSPPPPPFVP